MELDRTRTDACGQMISNARTPLIVVAVTGALAVFIGAFGAHGLPDWLARVGVNAEFVPRRVAQFETGARYHLAHAIVLLGMIALPVQPGAAWRWSFGLFVAGIVLFSGSLYVLVLTNTPWLGMITPMGGVCWIVAWILIAFLRPSSRNA